MLSDFFLWWRIHREIHHVKGIWRFILFALFWFPLAFYAAGLLVAAFIPFLAWKPSVKTWYFALLLIFYGSRFIPSLLLFIEMVVSSIIDVSSKSKEIANEKSESRRRFITNLGIVGAGFLLSGMLAGILRWAGSFRVHKVFFPVKSLPAAFRHYRIVQISDLHLGSWASVAELDRAISLVLEQKPDLIVFTGDLVNYSTAEAFPFEASLQRLRAPDGVLAVLGNHDYGGYTRWPSAYARRKNLEDLKKFYHRIGWKLLNNENVIIRKENQEIAVAGVENWGAHSRFPKRGNIQKALQGIEHVRVKILLSHDPTHWQNIVTQLAPDVLLTLSGHTHGMQLGIETAGIRWSPAKYFYKYWAGLYSNADETQYLYVNRGLGTIGYPGRIGILPEITLIELMG
ncbi:MAG: metallophosphoesterase [Bacteroidales bacterium]